MDADLDDIAGIPCRFCMGPGNVTGSCPDCGKPNAAPKVGPRITGPGLIDGCEVCGNLRCSCVRRRMLHLLRNPWGHDDEDVRNARLDAADLIEKLARELAEAQAERDELREMENERTLELQKACAELNGVGNPVTCGWCEGSGWRTSNKSAMEYCEPCCGTGKDPTRQPPESGNSQGNSGA